MKVLVLHGGESPEREVSFKSARTVIRALQEVGHDVSVYDPLEGVEGLKNAASRADEVFPILHGVNGEDGKIQLLLEKLGVQFLGANSAVSKLAFDKFETHKVLEEHGVLMPEYEIVDSISYRSSRLSKHPHVLKPINGGSSLDMEIVRDVNNQSIDACHKLLVIHNKMILEELIIGQELTVSILENKTLPVALIMPPENEEFDYENKYNGKSKDICPIDHSIVSEKIQNEAQSIALKVNEILGARHLSRVDIMLSTERQLYVLELNTMPGLTDQSLFPVSVKAAGISMPQLAERFTKLVIKES